jgi:sigma-B regulation protein RsbU (phosphoserine phosphatase)
MLSAVNLSLGERRIDGQFVSIIYAVWDDERRTLQVRIRAAASDLLSRWEDRSDQATGLPLGLFDEADYDELVSKPGAAICSCFIAMGFSMRGIATAAHSDASA